MTGTLRFGVAMCAAWIASSLFGAPAWSQESGETYELLDRGVQVYAAALETADRGARLEAFRNAERLFAAAASKGSANAELQVNLGNAALAGERLGPAVLAYRRALLAEPTHPRAAQNLDHARSLLPPWVPRPEPAGMIEGSPLLRRLTAPGFLPFAGAGCFALAALLLALGIRLDRGGLRLWAAVFGLAWLALLAWGAWGPRWADSDAAVVIAEEATARSADSALAPSALPQSLPGGAEVRRVESRSPWVRVRLANGRDVWLLESALAFVEIGRGTGER